MLDVLIFVIPAITLLFIYMSGVVLNRLFSRTKREEKEVNGGIIYKLSGFILYTFSPWVSSPPSFLFQ